MRIYAVTITWMLLALGSSGCDKAEAPEEDGDNSVHEALLTLADGAVVYFQEEHASMDGMTVRSRVFPVALQKVCTDDDPEFFVERFRFEAPDGVQVCYRSDPDGLQFAAVASQGDTTVCMMGARETGVPVLDQPEDGDKCLLRIRAVAQDATTTPTQPKPATDAQPDATPKPAAIGDPAERCHEAVEQLRSLDFASLAEHATTEGTALLTRMTADDLAVRAEALHSLPMVAVSHWDGKLQSVKSTPTSDSAVGQVHCWFGITLDSQLAVLSLSPDDEGVLGLDTLQAIDSITWSLLDSGAELEIPEPYKGTGTPPTRLPHATEQDLVTRCNGVATAIKNEAMDALISLALPAQRKILSQIAGGASHPGWSPALEYTQENWNPAAIEVRVGSRPAFERIGWCGVRLLEDQTLTIQMLERRGGWYLENLQRLPTQDWEGFGDPDGPSAPVDVVAAVEQLDILVAQLIALGPECPDEGTTQSAPVQYIASIRPQLKIHMADLTKLPDDVQQAVERLGHILKALGSRCADDPGYTQFASALAGRPAPTTGATDDGVPTDASPEATATDGNPPEPAEPAIADADIEAFCAGWTEDLTNWRDNCGALGKRLQRRIRKTPGIGSALDRGGVTCTRVVADTMEACGGDKEVVAALEALRAP